MEQAQVRAQAKSPPRELPLPKSGLRSVLQFVFSLGVGTLLGLCWTLLVTSLGLALNWCFLVASGAVFGGFSDEGFRAMRWFAIVFFGIFFPGFYFLAGQSQWVRVMARHVYQRHKQTCLDFLLVLLHKYSSGFRASVPFSKLKDLKGGFEGLPWSIRLVMKYCLRQKKFPVILNLLLVDRDFEQGNFEAVKAKHGARIDECILASALGIGTKGFWIVCGSNLALLAFTWYWLLAR